MPTLERTRSWIDCLLAASGRRKGGLAADPADGSGERLRNLFEAAFEGLAVSQDGAIAEANGAFLRMFGYDSLDDLRQVRPELLAAPESRALVVRMRSEESEAAYEAILLRKDGTRFEAELRGRRIELDGRPARVTAVRDLTERRAAERAVRENEAAMVEAQRTAGIGSWGWDVETGRIAWSAQLFRMLGLDAAQGEPDYAEMMALHHPEDAPLLRSAVERCLAQGEPYELDLRVRQPDGSYRWMGAIGRGERGMSGSVDRLSGTLTDIHERKSLDLALRESESRLALAQAVAGVGSWSVELASGRAFWSAEMFRLFAVDPADGIPPAEEVFGRYHPEDVGALRSAFERCAERGEPYDLNARVSQYGGAYRWMRNVGQLERDGSGQGVRVFGTVTDVHALKTLEEDGRRRAEALRDSEAALRALLRAAPVVLFAADAQGTVTLSKGAGLASLGLQPGQAVGRSVFDLNPDPESAAALRLALDGETVRFEAWHGEVCLMKEVRPLTDERGELTGIIGVAVDVTERKRAETELADSRRRLELATKAAASGVWEFEPTAGVLRWDERAHELFGLRVGEVEPSPAAFAAALHPHDRERTLEAVEAALRTGDAFGLDFRAVTPWGEVRHIESHALPERDARGALLKFVGINWDVTARRQAELSAQAHAAQLEAANDALRENQRMLDERMAEVAEMNVELEAKRYALNVANERLSTLATTDGLTGLKNQRTFRERLEEECAEAWRQGRDLSVLLLDVDRFKAYNDAFGHPAGDEALKAVAEVLRGHAREYDLAARNGGEEFALLLPGAGLAGARAVAERVRAAVEARDWPLRPVTVSVGVATLLPGFQAAGDLVEAADRALYEAKREGRNRVGVATLPAAEPEAPLVQRTFPVPANEAERLEALHGSGAYRTGSEEAFDTLAEAAALAMGVPIALVSLVGEDEQWFKAKVGLDVACTGRDVSFCTHAMLEERPMVVPDATQDPRFADNALVTGEFGLRFYAGAPILTAQGLPLGSLCAIDTVPREPTPEQVRMLERLARQASRIIEAGRGVAEAERVTR